MKESERLEKVHYCLIEVSNDFPYQDAFELGLGMASLRYFKQLTN